MASPNPVTIHLENVQALIHRQYRERFSAHLLLHLHDGPRGKRLLHGLLPNITFASVPVDSHRKVFARRCIVCHSSKQSDLFQEFAEDEKKPWKDRK